jgi:hypothetical protein
VRVVAVTGIAVMVACGTENKANNKTQERGNSADSDVAAVSVGEPEIRAGAASVGTSSLADEIIAADGSVDDESFFLAPTPTRRPGGSRTATPTPTPTSTPKTAPTVVPTAVTSGSKKAIQVGIEPTLLFFANARFGGGKYSNIAGKPVFQVEDLTQNYVEWDLLVTLGGTYTVRVPFATRNGEKYDGNVVLDGKPLPAPLPVEGHKISTEMVGASMQFVIEAGEHTLRIQVAKPAAAAAAAPAK